MKCYQCSKPSMSQVGDQAIPLCLDCYFKFSQINQLEFENHERMQNFAIDEMDGQPRQEDLIFNLSRNGNQVEKRIVNWLISLEPPAIDISENSSFFE